MAKTVKNKFTKWIFPTCAVLAIIILLGVNLIIRGNAEAESVAGEDMKAVVLECADNLADDFCTMTTVGESFCHALQDGTIEYDPRQCGKALSIIIRDTKAYKAVLLDRASGIAIDEMGQEIDMKSFSYYEVANEKSFQTYIYVRNDDLIGKQAMISVIPFEQDGLLTHAMMLYYNLDDYSSAMKNDMFGDNTFYALTDSAGNLYTSIGAPSVFARGSSIFDQISMKNDPKGTKFLTQMRGHVPGYVTFNTPEETRTLVSAPVQGVAEMCLVVGANEEFVNSLYHNYWETYLKILYEVLAVVLVIIISFGLATFVNKIGNMEKHRQLEERADTDQLTGLNNKLSTERKIKEYMQFHPDNQCALVLLDLDNFKKINDTRGHAFGDLVLKSLGNDIGILFRATDVLGRIGGDEFMIFLKNVNTEADLRKQAQKIVDFFKSFEVGEYAKYKVTSSIGMAVYPKEGSDFESLYKSADKALYKAKERGKNQLAFYDDNIEPVK